MKKILFALLILIIGSLSWKFLLGGEGVQVGNVAPDFDATLQDGSSFTLSDLRGNYVLLDFWGSWCAPCRRENPSLVKLYQDFENKKSSNGEGLEYVNIALEKMKGRAEGAIKRDNLYWNHHIISLSRIVLLSPLAQKYKVASIPSKFLINPQGKIMSINPSVAEIRQTLGKYLK